MALNLSTLTSSATSGDVLAEALTTADFLENVPVLRNLSRGSNKGGDAKQDVALNQPKALPYDGKGYLYLSGVSGNYASVPDAANLNGLTDFVMEAKDVYMSDWTTGIETFFAKFGAGGNAFTFRRNNLNINVYAVYGAVGVNAYFAHGLTGAATVSIRLTRDDTSVTCELDTGSGYVAIGSAETVPADAIVTTTSPIEIGGRESGTVHIHTGKISRARMWNNATMAGSPVLDVDFTATNIRHGDTKFACATGQVVTINKSGNDPATVIKKSVLRFANTGSTNIALQGLLNQTITDGYFFAAFSVLGNGGESYARVFSMNSTGALDNQADGFAVYRNSSTNNFLQNYNGLAGSFGSGLFDDAMGDVLIESDFKNSSQIITVNNADRTTHTTSGDISSEEFKIVSFTDGGFNAAIDLEFLAVFPASITDAQADSVRNYINNRNNVFDLKDGFGYYFYDATKAPVGAITTGSSSWNGRIVGSDFGDSDRYATQGTTNDAPVGDGFKVTFADNTDHLDIPQVTQAGWQVVGTSLGTFAYKVNANAVTELNLLGNLGSTSYRQAGDLYGVILLPESATGKDIEEARKLLIDRGSLDGSLVSAYFANWVSRNDIVEFHSVDLSNATNVSSAWDNCSSLTTFPALNLSGATNISYSWVLCSSLNNFGAIDARNGTNFTGAWKDCSALTSFPADAKLGTAATGSVSFSSAWQSSGLTSFSTPLPTATAVNLAWINCTSLTSFSSELPLVTNVSQAWQTCTSLTSFNTELPSATAISYAWYNCTSLSSFNTTDIKKGSNFFSAWHSCSALTSFPSDALLGTEANGASFTQAWRQSGLTSFSTPLPTATNVYLAWYKCLSLTSFSSSLPLATNARQAWTECTSLTSFNTSLPLSSTMFSAWEKCSSLSDFSADVFANWNPAIIFSGVFNLTWDGCTSLTAQSVENILTSIDASNQHGTDDGTSTGNPLGDSGIDIDYNVATGSLSAATNAAIDSLSGKGWEVIINNVNLSLNNTYSVAFDGTDDYMNTTLPVLGNTHTLSAWFKTTASYGGAGSEGTLISYISNGGEDSVLAVFSNKVGWSDFVDDNQFGTSTVNDGNWHHAVAVVTATTQKIYVDGVLETTTTNAYSAGTSFSHFALGRRANAPQRFFNGNIDEVAIWNSELSATDVTAIYNGGRPVNLNVNTNGYDNSSTLAAWWRMGDNDSGTGSEVTDNSANSYNGTLVNGPTFQTNTP